MLCIRYLKPQNKTKQFTINTLQPNTKTKFNNSTILIGLL